MPPLDFTRKRDNSDEPRRRPPDFMSRGSRIRMFVMLATLMLVTVFLTRVRDPEFWNFMTWKPQGIAGGPPLTKNEISHRNVDTELRLPRDRELTDAANVLVLGHEEKNKPRAKTAKEKTDADDNESATKSNDATADPLARAWLDAWTGIFQKFDSHERSLLFQGLKAARDKTSLSTDDQKAWAIIIENASQEWGEYCETAKKSLATLPETEREGWAKLVDQLTDSWKVEVRPALDRIGEGLDVSGEDAKSIEKLQSVLDQVALTHVDDDSLVRAADTESWFRFIEQLQAATPEEFRKKSIGLVGFLQLFEQPKLYRGKVVTVRGTVRRVSYELARKNHCGIKGYYVFWVMPAGGPDSPLVVYSLEIPPGFPKIDTKSEEPTAVHEDVEFSGFFFKRWVYSSKSGIRLAPLLVAGAPRWQASPADLRKPPDTTTVLAIVVSCAIGGVLVAFYAYRQSLLVGRPGSAFNKGMRKGRES